MWLWLQANCVLCGLLSQSTKFSSNLMDATKAFSIVVTDKSELEGLPDSLLQLFSQVYFFHPPPKYSS